MTIRCRVGVAIQSYSMENSLRKLLQKFERDPTVGSKVLDLWSRYSGLGGGNALQAVVVVE